MENFTLCSMNKCFMADICGHRSAVKTTGRKKVATKGAATDLMGV
jgi:hypothetical protein